MSERQLFGAYVRHALRFDFQPTSSAPEEIRISASDEVLMDRVQAAANVDAFEQLYDRHHAGALHVARSICRDDRHAEDVVQEGFHAIWRSRLGYHNRSGLFKAWAMTIVRHRAIDAIRRERGRGPASALPDETLTAANHPQPLELIIANDEAASMRARVSALPSPQSEAITLAFFGELSYSEVAATLDLPPGTVKSRIRLGLGKLRVGIGETPQKTAGGATPVPSSPSRA